MNKRNILSKFLSLSLVALVLFLSCDERTPVSSPPPELAYRLSLYVDNTTKNCDEEELPDTGETCSESTAYAANNAIDQLKITAQLEIDNGADLHKISVTKKSLKPKRGLLNNYNYTFIKGEGKMAENVGWNKKLYSIDHINNFKRKKIKLIPYFLWANRKVGEMKVWFVNN